MFRFRNEDDLDGIKESLTAEFGEVKVKKPLLPKIKIISVPSYFDTSNKEYVNAHIIENNPFIGNLASTSREPIEFLFSYDINNRKTLIVRCSPLIRAAIHKNGDRLKIGVSLCRVYDRIHVLQCNKCCRFGHHHNNCKAEEVFCAHCSEKHSSRDCPHKKNTQHHSCINCLLSKTESIKINATKHNAFSFQCPLYINERNRIISRTEFGIKPSF